MAHNNKLLEKVAGMVKEMQDPSLGLALPEGTIDENLTFFNEIAERIIPGVVRRCELLDDSNAEEIVSDIHIYAAYTLLQRYANEVVEDMDKDTRYNHLF